MMYTFLCFNVDSNIKFPEDIYYIKYKDVLFKYFVRYKEKRADNLIVCYRGDENIAYKQTAEYLNALAFKHRAFVHFNPVIGTHNDYSILTKLKPMTDYPKRYDSHTCVQYPCLVANIENDVQSNLVSLFQQAYNNENVYFRVLFFWHALVYPNQDEQTAIDYINENINRVSDFHHKHIQEKPLFSNNGKISTSLGEYIYQGIRHSIAHIMRNKPFAVSLKIDDWEQLKHVGTVARILEDLARYRIEKHYNVKGFPAIESVHEFYPDKGPESVRIYR